MIQENNNQNSSSSSSSGSSVQRLKKIIKEKDKKIEEQDRKLEKLKSFVPNEIEEITQKVYRKRLTRHDLKGQKGIRKKDEKKNTEITEYCDYYKKGNIGFLLNPTGMIRLKGEVPKVYASQDKNVKLLCALVMLQQAKKKKQTAKAKFTFREYAKWRDYSEKEITEGGKAMEELKKDLYTGAYLTYQIPIVKKGGELYMAHGIPNFYTLFEPITNPKKEWEIAFTPSYAKGILRFLRGEKSQYFVHFLKEISDRETTRRPYLHFFYDELVFRRREGITLPVKVKNLLERMGVNEQYLERPQKCFEVLRECLIYFSEKYPEELQRATLTAVSEKAIKQATEKDKIERSGILPISNFKKLEEKSYEDFKEILMRNIGTTDVREALISFEREEKEYTNLAKFVEDFFKWKVQCEKWGQNLSTSNEEIKKWLIISIQILGLGRMGKLFNIEINSLRPSVYHFLWKVVKPEREEKLREMKQKPQQF